MSGIMKGISALLSSVLLIAFTVAIATLVMGFYTSAVKSSTETIGNKTNSATECSSASINIEDVYVSGTTAATVRVIVKNNGFADNLVLQGSQVLNTTGFNFTTNNLPLPGFNKGNIATLTFYNVSLVSCPGAFSKVYVTTTCGGISDTYEGVPKCS